MFFQCESSVSPLNNGAIVRGDTRFSDTAAAGGRSRNVYWIRAFFLKAHDINIFWYMLIYIIYIICWYMLDICWYMLDICWYMVDINIFQQPMISTWYTAQSFQRFKRRLKRLASANVIVAGTVGRWSAGIKARPIGWKMMKRSKNWCSKIVSYVFIIVYYINYIYIYVYR